MSGKENNQLRKFNLYPVGFMNTQKNKFYVTTPIYYVTAKPHLGSLYSTLLADVTARWNKLLGKKTFFLTGTDEHGQKIAQAAQAAGKEPKEFVDSFIDAYKGLWKEYNLQYDYFIRTTDESHKKAVQDWLQRLLDTGAIYKSFYEGWYCTPCETYVTHEVVAGELTGPLCPTCNRATVRVAEESYFFKLSEYQDKLLAFYEQNPDFIVPKERANEVISFVKSGLKDLSISRTTITWGIPFPNDEQHVTYVWADALNNYITAIGYGQPAQQKEFAYWWPADLQILGKDIIRFHAVYWPAFLMASQLPMPKQLLVHGWIKVGEQKMSKSLGNAIDPQVLYETYGVDAIRYYLVRHMSINQDTEFRISDLEQMITSDLANDLGNLLNRMTTLAHKYDVATLVPTKVWSEKSLELRDHLWDVLDDYQKYMDEYSFHLALGHMWKFIAQTNAYFHAHEPWKLAATDKNAFVEVLSATAHSLRAIALMLWPVMPDKMSELLSSLGDTVNLKYEHSILDSLQTDPWTHTFVLKKIDTLFKKPEPVLVDANSPLIPKEASANLREKGHPDVSAEACRARHSLGEGGTKAEGSAAVSQANLKEKDETFIDITDFAKVQLMVGTIEQCEEVPKSAKLLKSQVNFGQHGIRQVLSGVKEFFAPADLIGKQGVFVFNLPPRKMMGIESQGMLLFAPDANGKLQLVTIAAPVPNGTQLR